MPKIIIMVIYYNTLNRVLKIHESIMILKKVGGGRRRRKGENAGMERKFFFTEICEEISVNEMIKLENDHFVAISILVSQGKIMNGW